MRDHTVRYFPLSPQVQMGAYAIAHSAKNYVENGALLTRGVLTFSTTI